MTTFQIVVITFLTTIDVYVAVVMVLFWRMVLIEANVIGRPDARRRINRMCLIVRLLELNACVICANFYYFSTPKLFLMLFY